MTGVVLTARIDDTSQPGGPSFYEVLFTKALILPLGNETLEVPLAPSTTKAKHITGHPRDQESATEEQAHDDHW